MHNPPLPNIQTVLLPTVVEKGKQALTHKVNPRHGLKERWQMSLQALCLRKLKMVRSLTPSSLSCKQKTRSPLVADQPVWLRVRNQGPVRQQFVRVLICCHKTVLKSTYMGLQQSSVVTVLDKELWELQCNSHAITIQWVQVVVFYC